MTEVAHKIKVRGLGTVPLRSSMTSLVILSIVFGAIGIYTFLTSVFLVDVTTILVGASIGGAILIFTIVFFVTPIFIGNKLTPTRLIIRYGILFGIGIPLSDIRKVDQVDTVTKTAALLGKGFKLGVEHSAIDHRYSVLRSKKGMVLVSLRSEIVDQGLFNFRRIQQIVFDTLDSQLLIDRVLELRVQDL